MGGKRLNKAHTLCVRCGKRSYHIQKGQCSSCGYPHARTRSYNWSWKAKRRKTTGSGRMRYMRHVDRRGRGQAKEGLGINVHTRGMTSRAVECALPDLFD